MYHPFPESYRFFADGYDMPTPEEIPNAQSANFSESAQSMHVTLSGPQIPMPVDAVSAEDPYGDIRKDVREKLEQVKSFWFTLKEVFKTGKTALTVPFHMPSDSRIMTAWKFSAWQSAAAGTIAGLVGKLFPDSNVNLPLWIHGHHIWVPSLLTGMLIPFASFILAKGASLGSLRRSDYSPKRERAAYRAFLYLDNAYCLVPQVLFACSVNVVPLGIKAAFSGDSDSQSLSKVTAFILGPMFFASYFWMQFVYFRVIPRRLFVLNGYSGAKRPPFYGVFSKKANNQGPWIKYRFFISWAWLVAIALAVLAGVLGGG